MAQETPCQTVEEVTEEFKKFPPAVSELESTTLEGTAHTVFLKIMDETNMTPPFETDMVLFLDKPNTPLTFVSLFNKGCYIASNAFPDPIVESIVNEATGNNI